MQTLTSCQSTYTFFKTPKKPHSNFLTALHLPVWPRLPSYSMHAQYEAFLSEFVFIELWFPADTGNKIQIALADKTFEECWDVTEFLRQSLRTTHQACVVTATPPLMKYFKYLIRFAKGEGNQLVNQSLGVSTLGGGDGKELLLAHPGCSQKENLTKQNFETSAVGMRQLTTYQEERKATFTPCLLLIKGMQPT